MKNKMIAKLFLVAFVVSLVACGGGGGGGGGGGSDGGNAGLDDGSSTSGTGSTASIGGTVEGPNTNEFAQSGFGSSILQAGLDFFSPSTQAAISGLQAVSGALVELIRISDEGVQVDEVLASTRTSFSGEYSLELPTDINLAGNLVVHVSGRDASGDTITMGALAADHVVNINPLSQFVLDKFVEHPALVLADLDIADVVAIRGRAENFNLLADNTLPLVGMLKKIETEIGEFLDNELYATTAKLDRSGRVSSAVEGNWNIIEFQLGLHDSDDDDGYYTSGISSVDLKLESGAKVSSDKKGSLLIEDGSTVLESRLVTSPIRGTTKTKLYYSETNSDEGKPNSYSIDLGTIDEDGRIIIPYAYDEFEAVARGVSTPGISGRRVRSYSLYPIVNDNSYVSVFRRGGVRYMKAEHEFKHYTYFDLDDYRESDHDRYLEDYHGWYDGYAGRYDDDDYTGTRDDDDRAGTRDDDDYAGTRDDDDYAGTRDDDDRAGTRDDDDRAGTRDDDDYAGTRDDDDRAGTRDDDDYAGTRDDDDRAGTRDDDDRVGTRDDDSYSYIDPVHFNRDIDIDSAKSAYMYASTVPIEGAYSYTHTSADDYYGNSGAYDDDDRYDDERYDDEDFLSLILALKQGSGMSISDIEGEYGMIIFATYLDADSNTAFASGIDTLTFTSGTIYYSSSVSGRTRNRALVKDASSSLPRAFSLPAEDSTDSTYSVSETGSITIDEDNEPTQGFSNNDGSILAFLDAEAIPALNNTITSVTQGIAVAVKLGRDKGSSLKGSTYDLHSFIVGGDNSGNYTEIATFKNSHITFNTDDATSATLNAPVRAIYRDNGFTNIRSASNAKWEGTNQLAVTTAENGTVFMEVQNNRALYFEGFVSADSNMLVMHIYGDDDSGSKDNLLGLVIGVKR